MHTFGIALLTLAAGALGSLPAVSPIAAEAKEIPAIDPSPPKPDRQLNLSISEADARDFALPSSGRLRNPSRERRDLSVRRQPYAQAPSFRLRAEPLFRDEDRVQELPSASEDTGRLGDIMDSIEIEAVVLRLTTPLPF